MAQTAGGCRDLRKYQNDEAIQDAFSKLVSGGKPYYKTVLLKKEEVKACSQCHIKLEGNEKFCPECGAKTEWQKKKEEPVVLLSPEELEQQFKKGEKKETEIFAYMRDMLKLPEVTVFELVNRWKKDMQPKEENKIDLNQFKG